MRVKVKRILEYEPPVSSHSRGTLGGFLPLREVGSGNSSLDGSTMGKGRMERVEKECILTQMTKKIGLGIYTRVGGASGGERIEDQEYNEDDDERETWYMFYPPPPSPSLDLDPEKFDEKWESDSGSDAEGADEDEPVSATHSPTSGKGCLYPDIISHPRISAVGHTKLETTTGPYPTSEPKRDVGMEINALILSAEDLAKDYRDLLQSRTSSPAAPPIPPRIRKIRGQHSLRTLASSSTLNQDTVRPLNLTSSLTFVTTSNSTADAEENHSVNPPLLPKQQQEKAQKRKSKKEPPEPPARESSQGKPAAAMEKLQMQKSNLTVNKLNRPKSPPVPELPGQTAPFPVLPSSLLKRQWEQAFHGVPIPVSEHDNDKVLCEDRDLWAERRRYGIVGAGVVQEGWV